MTLLVAGFATFVQARRIGPIGSGLLSIQGPSFAFLPPIFSIIAVTSAAGSTPEETLALILGMGFFGSFIQMILSRFLHFAKIIFPPIVTGTAVTLIGLTLIRFGMHDMAGGDVAQEAGDYGSLRYWAVSIPVFVVVAVCSANTNRYLRMGSVIIGLIVGSIIAIISGMTDFSQLSSIPAFNVPIPFRFGLDFNFATFIPFAMIMLMFGTVAVAGFNILREINMTNRSLVIVGASLAAGLGVPYIPEALTGFPEQLRSILESGISVGSLCALILNLVLPKSLEDRVSEEPVVTESEISPINR